MGEDEDRAKVFPRGRERTEAFHQSARHLMAVIALLAVLLALVAIAVAAGPGFDPASRDPWWALMAAGSLAALLALFGWLLRRRPDVLRVGSAGLDLPIAFSRPLPWARIHRIRRHRTRGLLGGRRDWLIVDPAPGVLPDFRLPVWRRLELACQRRAGIHIPLHGLDADPAVVVASVERFRPVVEEG